MNATPRTRLSFFWHTSLNNLRRGGQRVLVALLCVAFGVMSLVGMTTLSAALERMLVITPEEHLGADLTMERMVEDGILPEHTGSLDAFVEQGKLEEYTLIAYNSSLAFRKADSGELIFPSAGLGVDPGAYPLAGRFVLQDPESPGLAELLQEPGAVLITRDLAVENDLQTGDTLFVSDLESGKPVEVRVRGIVTDTPNHQGSKLYYSHDTARQLAGGRLALNTALANAADPEAVRQALREAGWRAFTAIELADNDAEAQDMIAMVLNGAGVMGLLVGGVGIANTMQVLLRRRRREVAIWKMLGYGSRDLLFLFSIEAGLLGLAGSLLGAGLGVLVSMGFVELFNRTSNLLVSWQLDLSPLLMAVLVGVATTVIFSQWAIAGSSRVSPQALLRSEPQTAKRMPWFLGLLLLLALAIPFTAVVSLVMGALWKGAVVLLVALAGLAGLGGVLGGALRLLIKILPLRGAPLLNMARSSLRRRGLAPVFALIALFVGVAALAFSIVVTQNASRVVEATSASIDGDNLLVLAEADQAGNVLQAASKFAENGDVALEYETGVLSIHVAGNPDQSLSPLLISRQEAGEYHLRGAEWGSRPGVYTLRDSGIQEGAELEITLWDGSVHRLPVVGTYHAEYDGLMFSAAGVLLPTGLSESLAPPDQMKAALRVPAGGLEQAASTLGESLPETTIINLVAYYARFTETYRSLFIFAVSMASLALLAGALLIANSVSLGMLDRRYEIGVLKAMGYARRHILYTLVIEYTFIGLVSCAAGLLAVRVSIWLIGVQNDLAGNLLQLTPLAAGVVALLTFGLTMGSVLAATWKPTQVSPLVVLNDRE